MRWTSTLLAMCACNQVFDLRSTKSVDASREYFDAPIDAPFACPPPEETPRFAPLLHQPIFQHCKDYAPLATQGKGMALCDNGTYVLDQPSEGPLDGPLTGVPGFDDPGWNIQFLDVAPDGDEMFVTYYQSVTGYQVRTFRRTSTGWERRPDFFSTASFLSPSNPTGGPERHALRSEMNGTMTEFAEDTAGTWNQVGTITTAQLGVSYVSYPSLSSDGLRLVLYGILTQDPVARMLYTARASLAEPFRPASALEGVPLVTDAVMNDDCSRVYFSGLQSVFYVQRL